jgi:hypothetical protein
MEESISGILKSLKYNIKGWEDVDEDNVNQWFNVDKNEPGYKRMTDDELVQSALEMPEMTEGPSISPEADDEEKLVQPSYKVSYKEALTAAETLLYFMENQDDIDYVDLLQIHEYITKIKNKMANRKIKQKLWTF